MTSRLTDLKSKDKIQELMNEYHLGYSRIEDIINLEEEEADLLLFYIYSQDPDRILHILLRLPFLHLANLA